MEKLGGIAGVEVKYDGTRVQLHMDKKRMVEIQNSDQLSFFDNKKKMPYVRSFTRNLEESTGMFPDLVKAAIEQIDADSVILDGEAVGYDPKTQKMIPFQETSQRKRKHGILEKVNEIPLRYFVFDLLYLNGKPLLNLSFDERRKKLQEIVKKGEIIVVDEQKIVRDPNSLLEFFKEVKGQGLEGVVMKKLDSKYEAGGRGYSWVKFKREESDDLEDTIDGVILGYYLGKGNRAKFGIGGFLVGLFDPNKDGFVTVCKVGSGPTEEEWQEIKRRADKIKSSEKPSNVEVEKTLIPDVWSKPEIVVVIRADEITVSEVHTAGYALRFPRLMAFRDDKNAKGSTTPEEVKTLFDIQQKKRK
jgi:DNA ligase-1